jgi:hypothetical protein
MFVDRVLPRVMPPEVGVGKRNLLKAIAARPIPSTHSVLNSPLFPAPSESIDITKPVDQVTELPALVSTNMVCLGIGLDPGQVGFRKVEFDVDMPTEMLSLFEIAPDPRLEAFKEPVDMPLVVAMIIISI